MRAFCQPRIFSSSGGSPGAGSRLSRPSSLFLTRNGVSSGNRRLCDEFREKSANTGNRRRVLGKPQSPPKVKNSIPQPACKELVVWGPRSCSIAGWAVPGRLTRRVLSKWFLVCANPLC